MDKQADMRSAYVLGHAPEEQQRLMCQAQFVDPLTERLFRDAGLTTGDRVLDLGCGVGDVSQLAAEIAGPSGIVFGIDRSPEAIETAARRASQAGFSNIRFIQHDLNDVVSLALDAPVDAVVGRFVLMYLAQPAVTLRRVLSWLRPGGVIAFQEIDADAFRSEPRCELWHATVERIQQTFTRAGVDPRFALKQGHIFEQAGLPAPQMSYAARVERGPASAIYEWVAGTTRTLLPMMERFGIAEADDVGIDTLAERLREEAVTRDATLVSPAFVGVCARS
jgi:ubiquinone/menaquinone biosynthesis C-methylase UbiE